LCRSNGAFAQLFDITSLYPGSEFSKIQDDTYSDWNAFQSADPTDSNFVQQLESKYGITSSAQLYYIYDNAGNPDPVLSFSNPTADVFLNVTGDIPSPDGSPNFDWQEMTGAPGSLPNIFFQVSTKGGEQLVSTVSISRSETVARN
jgi:hypothetical protein